MISYMRLYTRHLFDRRSTDTTKDFTRLTKHAYVSEGSCEGQTSSRSTNQPDFQLQTAACQKHRFLNIRIAGRPTLVRSMTASREQKNVISCISAMWTRRDATRLSRVGNRAPPPRSFGAVVMLQLDAPNAAIAVESKTDLSSDNG